ncbi:nicotinate-nucleotide adenylyltransferase [Alkalilimnicola ehrlichii MLHE-1]|uniref:Probable nicotinate-nucleotide adenylyltransferase n=1 Tax=Alkalilimnicola ehrlichii (strain ATCC BAA-1101 / DSM 17681 / MLHE-1) TaxID=187272 RepID=Q0ABM9_ALKEH|nr:nicotinate-nucleotide adenylyltransferase [Alkalilimnicola ehrlichii]ABI55758.1 nicotinate-nucleotide adenylyltransferase [Alkalilimnicola ehrlichii MLHE-1]
MTEPRALTGRTPLGLFGGTFDPVHYGHLRPALEAQQALGLASVRLLPCRLPPHRARPGRDAGQRLDLLRLGAREVPGFRVDDRELHRSGPSYTVDTLRHLRQEQGSARPLVLLMGADSLAGLGRWHRWRELFDYAHVVVLDRPGHASQPDGEVAAEVAGRWLDGPGALRDAPAGGFYRLPVTPLAISATRIRRLLAQGRSVRFLLPEAVRRHIHQQGLYGYPQV